MKQLALRITPLATRGVILVYMESVGFLNLLIAKYGFLGSNNFLSTFVIPFLSNAFSHQGLQGSYSFILRQEMKCVAKYSTHQPCSIHTLYLPTFQPWSGFPLRHQDTTRMSHTPTLGIEYFFTHLVFPFLTHFETPNLSMETTSLGLPVHR